MFLIPSGKGALMFPIPETAKHESETFAVNNRVVFDEEM